MATVVESEGSVILQAGQSKVEILPGCGAILNSWQVQMHDKAWQLIEGYDSVNDFYKNCEAKGFRSCKLSPFVCRMNKGEYELEEQQFKIEKFYLPPHAIHGLLYNVPFVVTGSFADEETATVILRHTYEGVDKGYPFRFEVEVTYTLTSQNQLGLSTSVSNLHNNAIPVSDGWHPYFMLNRPVDELELMMQTSHLVEFDDTLIPTGSLVDYHTFNKPSSLKDVEFDNCFKLKNTIEGAACRIINRRDNIEVSIYPDISYPYLQVYIPPHRKSIAIENLSSAPDAFNNNIGLIYLDPKETISFSTSYRVSSVQ